VGRNFSSLASASQQSRFASPYVKVSKKSEAERTKTMTPTDLSW